MCDNRFDFSWRWGYNIRVFWRAFQGSYRSVPSHESVCFKIMENVLRNWGSFFRKKKSGKPLSPQARGCGNEILSKKGKTYRSIKEDLGTYCTLVGATSVAAIGNVFRNKIPEGPFTRKRMVKPSSEKFTLQNLVYCQHFIDYPQKRLSFSMNLEFIVE